MVEGVSQVITYGSPYAVRVQVDPEKLAAKNIGLDQVTALIRAGNVNLPSAHCTARGTIIPSTSTASL